MWSSYSIREQSLAVKERAEPAFPAVVIGGSAGALDPLRQFVSKLPAEFPAAVFVANHVPPDSVSALPHLLARAGALFATHAIDNAPIAPSRIIVAPPDHHLLIEDGVMRVSQGPMENNQRPSIDVLFRSAALNFKSATCGILLSGTLDDGSAGLVAIHEAGGATFVQDPDDAQFPDMPLNALATGAVDGAHPANRLYDAVRMWLQHQSRAPTAGQLRRDEREAGTPAYNPASRLGAYDEKLESLLWASIRALEERRDLLRRMARRSLQNSQLSSGHRYEQQAAEVEADLEQLHGLVARPTAAPSLA